MSKNKHMLSEMITVIDPEGRTRGAVSLVQGAYGRRGNLELVACDRTDGLWVFWFNADLPTDPCDTPDVPAGTWSRGLPFATGARYAQAAILQSTLGPDHLEVLALRADGTLESWYWSPGPGFQRRATDVATLAFAPFVAPQAQAEYPEKPLRILVATAPGGAGDINTRLLAEKAQQFFGQPIVVENRVGGAAAALATQVVLNAPPDGYTAVYQTTSMTILPWLTKLAFDPEELAPVIRTGRSTYAFVVGANFPAKTFDEFVVGIPAHRDR